MNNLVKEIFEHIAILNAHIAKQIVEDEHIDDYCATPCDIAIISHDKKYVQRDYIAKMMHQLSEFDYMERRGEVFVLEEKWRRMLPVKSKSVSLLKEKGAYTIFLLQERLAKKFIEIAKNESQKIDLSDLVYFIDAVDGCEGLNAIRSNAISTLNLVDQPKKIFDYNQGLGYSTTQLSSIFPKSSIYSLQTISAFKDAYSYTINKFQRKNVEYSVDYPSEMMNKLMKEKVDLITLLNPLGIEIREIGRFLNISKQISLEGTKMLIQSPVTNNPKNSLIAEWLGLCVDGMGGYSTIENYKVLLSQHDFEVKTVKKESNFIIAEYCP